MASRIPAVTIDTFARSIFRESRKYGFDQIDVVRLVNALMDMSIDAGTDSDTQNTEPSESTPAGEMKVDSFPLESPRLSIRRTTSSDIEILNQWLEDDYGRHFLLSCASAQPQSIEKLLANPANEIGIVEYRGSRDSQRPIGAVAFLDIDRNQQRAELRKLIGVHDARGKGLAEEATMLWIEYGAAVLELKKFYVSTLQTNLRNIRLNESIGFRVEGILRAEIKLGDERHDVLRMGLSR